MNPPSTAVSDSHPYLRAATAGIRHHTRTLKPTGGRPTASRPADRGHLDALHTHLTTLHQLLDQLAETTRPPYPAAGRHLATARTCVWQATSAVHDAFHTLPLPDGSPNTAGCRPDQLLEGPPVLTICQRHLAATHTARRTTTPTDLKAALHGHAARVR